jgi:hypothetical protein
MSCLHSVLLLSNPQAYQGIIKDSYRLLSREKKGIKWQSLFFFFFVCFFTTLSLLRLYSIAQCVERLMNWKGFGRKLSWHKWSTIQVWSSVGGGGKDKSYCRFWQAEVHSGPKWTLECAWRCSTNYLPRLLFVKEWSLYGTNIINYCLY